MSDALFRTPEAPLDSWKAIATYLNRDVRTVRRWEAAEGLPVHRHRHLARSSVYAYPTELDAWRASRRPEKQATAPQPSSRRAHAIMFASLLVASFVSAGDGLNRASPAAQERGVVARQIWTGTDVDIQGMPTSDGRFLTFIDWTTGDVALRDLSAGTTRRVTNNGSLASSPEFGMWPVPSADGQHVAYLWFNGRELELRAASASAGAWTSRVLVRGEELLYAQPFAWSSDAQRLLAVLSRRDGTQEIALIAAGGGSVQTLKSIEWRYPAKMSLSPDGRFVAYDAQVRPGSADRDIFILAVDGRGETSIQHPAADHGPLWTPDGRSIVFASDRRGGTGLWRVSVSEGTPTGMAELLVPDIGTAAPMGFARDGSYYYAVRTGTEDIYVAGLDPSSGELTNAPTRLTERFTGSNLAPAWSPDGRLLAYVSRRRPLVDAPGSMAIVVRSLETGEERDLFPSLQLDRRRPIVRWFPDSRSLLLWAHDARGRKSLHRMDVRTGAIRVVRTDLGMPGFVFQPPALSPDGRTAYHFQVNDIMLSQSLVSYRIDAGRQQEVFRATGSLLSVASSKDGRRLALLTTGRENALLVLPATGGQPRELFRAREDGEGIAAQSLEWTNDDRFIVFVRTWREEGTTRSELWRIPSAGGEPQRMMSMEGLSFPSIDPSGRRLAFSAGQFGASTVWVMQNVLR